MQKGRFPTGLALSGAALHGRSRLHATQVDHDQGLRARCARVCEFSACGKRQLTDEESRRQVVTAAVNRTLRTV